MSTESSKSSISFIEILAILLFIVAIVFIFISRQDKGDQEKELRNAVRFQDVSALADAFWKVSISSTDYASIVQLYPTDIACGESTTSVADFETLLVPEHFELLPLDPNGESYRISFDENRYVTICSLWGEGDNGESKLISITR